MKMQYSGKSRGIAPLIIAVIVALVLIAGGATYFVVSKRAPAGPGAAKRAAGQPAAQAPAGGDALDALTVTAPTALNVGGALPSIDVGTLNVGAAAPAVGFANTKLDSKVNVDTKLNVTLPTVDLTVSPPPITQGAPSGSGQQPSGGQQGTVSAANCAQFSSMPSAQYCAQAGQGQQLCQQCKAAGY